MNIKIKGRIPSKKNSRNIFVRGGKIMNIPSTKYKEWHKEATAQLEEQEIPQDKVKYIEILSLVFYAPDKRKYDLTNKAESVMDLLVDYGFIEDDNYSVIPDISLMFGGVDKENPRVEIVLPECSNEDYEDEE